MTDLGFNFTFGISIASLIVAIWAICVSLKGSRLLVVISKSIQAMEAKSKRAKRQHFRRHQTARNPAKGTNLTKKISWKLSLRDSNRSGVREKM